MSTVFFFSMEFSKGMIEDVETGMRRRLGEDGGGMIASKKRRTRGRRKGPIKFAAICVAALVLTLFFGGGNAPVQILRRKETTTIPFNSDGVAHSAENLIVVACHSIAKRTFSPVTLPRDVLSLTRKEAEQMDEQWHLLDYQKNSGIAAGILLHISEGIRLALLDPKSLLLFSGGQTRVGAGPGISEGSSYYTVAERLGMLDDSEVSARTGVEEFAKDSFENLLFSVARFHEITGRYPQHITVVSFTFKKHRFANLHAKAIKWPVERFSFVGVDPPENLGFNLEKATAGEVKNSLKPYENDLYGTFSTFPTLPANAHRAR